MKIKVVFLSLTLLLIGFASAQSEPISPIAPVMDINLAEVELGKQLYFDPRLSLSGWISCNSCHNLSMGGTDNLPTSIGHAWNQGPINAPTVLNSSLNLAQFWDGRALTLQDQAGGPIANPGEMGSNHVLAVNVLKSIPGYVYSFKQVYGTADITIEMVTDAIATFEETLVTPNSDFDKWLMGDKDAINDYEKAGYDLFKNSGCVACHNGSAVGGNSFQKMGVIEPYQTSNPAEGLAGVTGKDLDRFKFKVPTLRNVEMTYPYFHDGATYSMTEAVDIMGRLQLGRKFSDDENAKIVAFLKTLTGDQPSFLIPILPPSVDETIIPHPFN